jgi:EAL domain-containing protein (putative c-di-GMP-specific phosphodiesterase class I)/CheY-like chemotaxis protein
MIKNALKEYEETLSLRGLSRKVDEAAPTSAAASVSPLRPRAFVIDDEEGICKFVATGATSLGYEADYFTSAQPALAALKYCVPDIIFLDIAIGGADAIDVLRQLAQKGYTGVVQLMSGSNIDLLEDVRRVGERHKLIMRPPLAKPFRMDAIRAALTSSPIDHWPEHALQIAEAQPVVELAEALSQGWPEVWYQPKFNLATRTLAGAEGLVRCRHPQHGVLLPGRFLPNADATSMAVLSQFVVLTALRNWQELGQLGFNLKFAVNASIGSLTDLDLPALIRQNRPASADWPGLILEVTEGEVAENVDLAHEIATQLRIYGINLAIDDFGEGYSSFARLRELPFAELKLDASFVKNCGQDSTNAGICQAVINLAHNFGAVAVAEGLEDPADIQAIQAMGCDIGQGFAFARPMPSALFTSILRDRAA